MKPKIMALQTRHSAGDGNKRGIPNPVIRKEKEKEIHKVNQITSRNK